MSAFVIVGLVVAALALVFYVRSVRPTPESRARPPAPIPIDPSTDPRPTQGEVDDLDEQIQTTDDIIHDLEVHDARPQLPADFTLDRPDPNAVDLLRELAGEDDDVGA